MILLKNALFVDELTFEFKKTNILVNTDEKQPLIFITDDEIFTISKDVEILDCQGKIVTRSFACGHHHAYSALARGMGGPLKPPANFYQTLQYLWWALDKSLDKTSIKASAFATALACVKNGVTFVIDHHASPFCTTYALETIAEAFDYAGIGHLLCFEISDRDGTKIARKGLETTENYLKNRQGLVGLHASFTVGDDTLKNAVALAEKYNSGIHIHTAEDLCDQDDSLEKYGMRVVERLHKAGVLNLPKSLLVHCLHLSENERELIANSPVHVAQNIESNLNNNVGIFNGKGLGPQIMLGTDGMHSDMLRSLKAAYIYGQTSEQLGMDMAYNRLRQTHNYLKSNNFEGDGPNNLIVLDYKSPTPVNSQNFLGHLIFGIESSDITHVISGGKLIMKDRVITTLDENKVLEMLRQTSENLWTRFKSQKV